MSTFTPIDLTGIPAPSVLETLSFETILAEMIADLQSRDPAFTALVESDPAYKILEVCAYRETVLRARVNDAAKAILLTYAIGTDLENLGALFGVTRILITPEDTSVFPVVEAVYESDESLRYRITLAIEGLSTAGPEGSYIFHALKTPTIKDVAVAGPPEVQPGNVRVTILSSNGNGLASAGEISAVQTALSADDVRPLTDIVYVQSAEIITYSLNVLLFVNSGPSSAVVEAEALKRVQEYVEQNHKIGADIRVSGIFAAAHISGVEHVELQATGEALTSDLLVTSTQAAYCSGVSVSSILLN